MITIALVRDRRELDQLDVPEEVDAVVVIAQPGAQDVVLPVSMLRQIVSMADRELAYSAVITSNPVFVVAD